MAASASPPRVRPSLAWLGLAGVFAVGGIAVAVVLFVATLRDATGPFTSFRSGAPLIVELEDGEGRGIYVQETGSELGPADSDSVTLHCAVRSAATGRPVELQGAKAVSVERGDDEYAGWQRFTAPRAGRYEVLCRSAGSPVPLALGPRLTAGGLLADIAAILGALFGGMLLAGLTVAVVLLLRDSHRSRLERQARGS